MADADVTIKDAADVDRKVDTRTVGAGTDENRQVVVLGDPTTAAGIAAITAAEGLDVDVTRLPGTIEDDIAAMAASLAALDDAISGNELQVDVVSGSAAGTEYTEDEVVIAVDAPGLHWRDDSDGHMEPVGSDTPLPVEVIAGATSATEYTEAATDSTLTGTMTMWEDTSDTVRAVSVAKPFPVQVVTSPGGSVLPDPVVDASAVAVPLKFASVNATADGDNTIVAAVSSKHIRVVAFVLTCTAAGTIAFKSGGSTTIGRLISSANGAGASYGGGVDAPICQTAVTEALVINNPTSVDTVGMLSYIEVA